MSKGNIMAGLKRTMYRTGFKLKKNSPEILVVAGVAGVVTSTVLACRATTKVTPILEEAKNDAALLNDVIENPEKLPEGATVEEAQNEVHIVYAKAGLEVAKLYAPSVLLGAVSIASILYSHKILSKRNVALGAAYAAIDRSFKEYRGRVVERFGDKLDKELRFGIKKTEIEEIEVNGKGKEKIVKKEVEVVETKDPNTIGDMARIFYGECLGYGEDPESNMLWLKKMQAFANEKLKEQGYLFMNDVYEMLGFPRTKEGQVVGWIYDEKCPVGDNFVDFGLYDTNNEATIRFVNGQEKAILLDFNHDGPILEKM